VRPCLVPPPVKQLVEFIQEALRIQQSNNRQRPILLGFSPKHLPDKEWALAALATLEPNHRIFGKRGAREQPLLVP
jgi:hypothetical protein